VYDVPRHGNGVPWVPADEVKSKARKGKGQIAMEDNPIHFCNDDGTGINPNFIAKPSLCTSCAKDDDPDEEPLCTLNRFDQRDEEDFQCEAYVPKMD
jgi:hypothetical protein